MSKISEQLNKVAKNVGEFDERIAEEILDVSEEVQKEEDSGRITDELNDVIDELESLEEGVVESIDNVVDELEDVAEASEGKQSKKASLINEGDRIVCLNPLQGIFKGRQYIAGEYVEPNFLVVKEETGERVGIYRADRFCLDNREY